MTKLNWISPYFAKAKCGPEGPNGKDMTAIYASRRIKGRKPKAPARKMGNWKLAYADFLTALCAFFLIMWIVHGVSTADKAVLAEQFSANSEASASIVDRPEETLAQSLLNTPTLREHSQSLIIQAEANSVRVEVTDLASRPLFARGDGALNARGNRIVETVGNVLATLPFALTIEGHTDNTPSLTPGYSNWELSTDRANAARRILVDTGVSANRIRAVSGRSDTRLLTPETPDLPVNRRISIVIWMTDEELSR